MYKTHDKYLNWQLQLESIILRVQINIYNLFFQLSVDDFTVQAGANVVTHRSTKYVYPAVYIPQNWFQAQIIEPSVAFTIAGIKYILFICAYCTFLQLNKYLHYVDYIHLRERFVKQSYAKLVLIKLTLCIALRRMVTFNDQQLC